MLPVIVAGIRSDGQQVLLHPEDRLLPDELDEVLLELDEDDLEEDDDRELLLLELLELELELDPQ